MYFSNRIVSYLMVVATCAVSACVTLPKTPDELRTQAPRRAEFVATRSLSESFAFVAEHTTRCHGRSEPLAMPIGGGMVNFQGDAKKIHGKVDEASGRAELVIQYFNPGHDGFLQVVDFAKVDDTSTRITVHQLNDTTMWRTATDAVEQWFAGNMECYRMYK